MLTLQHVTINTKDLDKSMEFYEEVFPFTKTERPDFPFKGAWYWIEPERTMLHLQENTFQLVDLSGANSIDHIALDANEPYQNTLTEHDRWADFLTSEEIQDKWQLDVKFHSFDRTKFLQIFIVDPINLVRWELNFPVKNEDEYR